MSAWQCRGGVRGIGRREDLGRYREDVWRSSPILEYLIHYLSWSLLDGSGVCYVLIIPHPSPLTSSSGESSACSVRGALYHLHLTNQDHYLSVFSFPKLFN